MKKLILLALLLMASAQKSDAQEVFKQMVSNAQLILQDPKADHTMINIAQFKNTALQYLCNTAVRVNGEISADELDLQAMALNNFITSYFSELIRARQGSSETQKKIMKRYWQACAENPMFENQDAEITEAFINDPDCITPFSINTNWVKAEEQVKKKK